MNTFAKCCVKLSKLINLITASAIPSFISTPSNNTVQTIKQINGAHDNSIFYKKNVYNQKSERY